MDIDRKNIVITGASSGIGYAIMMACLEFDCTVVAAAQNDELFQQVLLPWKDRVIPFAGDLGEHVNIDRLFDFAIERLGSIDIFIANAGFAYYESLQRADWSHIENIFRINTFSPIYSLLKMNELNQGRTWKTVIVSSAMAEWALSGYALYGATKSATHHFSKAYRSDNPGRNLMMVYPITTLTRLFEQAGTSVPVPRPAQTPEVVARKIIKGILSDQRVIYPSLFFRTLLNLNSFFPFIEKTYQEMQYQEFKRWQQKRAVGKSSEDG